MNSSHQVPNPGHRHLTLADACAAWQSGRDTGSTPIRAAARVLTGVPHYFTAPYITKLDTEARNDAPRLMHARLILEALASAGRRDIAEWRQSLAVDGGGYASRGIKAKVEADSQIEALVSARGAIMQMPLWGFSLSEDVALSYGRRFLFRLRGPFSAIAPWLHSGIKSAEQEMIGGGTYRVTSTRQEAETLVVDLEEAGHILPEPANVERLFSAFVQK